MSSTDEEVKGQDDRGGKHCSCGLLGKIVAIVEEDTEGQTHDQPTIVQESDLPSGGGLNVYKKSISALALSPIGAVGPPAEVMDSKASIIQSLSPTRASTSTFRSWILSLCHLRSKPW